jgi:hypothetical protein
MCFHENGKVLGGEVRLDSGQKGLTYKSMFVEEP